MKAEGVIKGAAIFMAGLAVAMLILNALGRSAWRPTKIAVLCPPDPSVTDQVTRSLESRGLQKDLDYRLEAFPCTPPNTFRQASVASVGSEAMVFVTFDAGVLTELKAAGRTATVVTAANFTDSMTELADHVKRIRQPSR